jgi:hypothetical protein
MSFVLQFTLNIVRALIMNELIKKIVSAILTKDRVIGFVAGVAIAAGGAAVDMTPDQVKEIICSVESK